MSFFLVAVSKRGGRSVQQQHQENAAKIIIIFRPTVGWKKELRPLRQLEGGEGGERAAGRT